MRIINTKDAVCTILFWCVLVSLSACGGMSASEVEKKVSSEPEALRIYLIQKFLGPVADITVEQVKVDNMYTKSEDLPSEWRNPNIHFDVLQEIAKKNGDTIIFAVVKIQGKCTGGISQQPGKFQGEVLYAVSNKMSPTPLLPKWQ